MQNISLHNYQDFLLRYIDEELDLHEREALLAFVALHPEAQEELELLQSTKLDIKTITCPSKALLYKNIFPVIVEPTTIVYPNKQKLFKKEKEKAPVVLLKDYEGYSYEEIGEITKLTTDQVRVYLHRARLKLRNYLISPQQVL